MEEGSAITVIVSRGASKRVLPEIANLSLVEASAKVTEAGFLPVKEDAYSDTVPEGLMIGYKDMQAGDELDYGAQVILIMSKGPDPDAGNGTVGWDFGSD